MVTEKRVTHARHQLETILVILITAMLIGSFGWLVGLVIAVVAAVLYNSYRHKKLDSKK